MELSQKAVPLAIIALIIGLGVGAIYKSNQEEVIRLKSYVPFEERINSNLTVSEAMRYCLSNCANDKFQEVTFHGIKAVKYVPGPRPEICTRIQSFSGGIRAISPDKIPSTMGEGPLCLYQEQYLGRE